MEEIRQSSAVVDSRKLDRSDVLVKKDPGTESMFEGKNIHSSPIDGKLLCSYSEKLCKQRRLNGYAFCIRHVLEDKNAPFKQCQYVAKYNGQQCTNPIPSPEDRIYCNSHLQVLGLVPKKARRKKASESQDSIDKETTHTMRDSRADVASISNHQKMPFLSPVVPHRHKKQKFKILNKQPDIPAISELKECLRTSKRDREDLFDSYEIDNSDSDSSDSDSMPWQQVWLPPYNGESCATSGSNGLCKSTSEARTAKISRLSSKLRRELHQLRRTLRVHRYRHPLVMSAAVALLKAAQQDVSASVDSVIEASKMRTFPPSCVIKTCSFSSEGNSCEQSAMPYTKYCSNHIINDNIQVLYSQCTAKWPGGLQCSVPVFDIVNERALCEEHARKKDKFQEAQAAAAADLSKQQAKKPRKKPQPKAIAEPKQPKKATNKKPPSRPSKPKSGKDVAKASPLNSSFSPNNSPAVFSPNLDMQMSDYSHPSDHSPVSPKLDDLSQFDSSLFEPQQQDHLLIPDMSVEDLPNNLSTISNGITSDEKLFGIDLKKGRAEKTTIWMPTSSVPASVITSRDSSKASSLLNSNSITGIPLLNSQINSKTSNLNTNKKNSRTVKAKKAVRVKSISPISGIISPTLLQHNHLPNGTSMSFNDDPMFSSSQEIAGIKTHGNGLPPDHLSHTGISMDSVLTSPHKSWSTVSSATNGPAYSSPLNSQNSLSRISSPPFSRVSLPSLSPHLSPNPSNSSVFTFDRTSHYQQSGSILSPTLSPVSPSYLSNASLKHSVFQQRDLDPSSGDDPFLTPVEEQPLLGGPFHQTSDSSLGDIRLR